MTAQSVVDQVLRVGGILELEGDRVRCWLPEDALRLADDLRACKPELIVLLQAQGGRVAVFPHCPRCSSFYLYREGNIGTYECQTCSLTGIEESLARRFRERLQ